MREYLTFRVNSSSELFGVELTSIIEILKYVRVTPLKIGRGSIVAVTNFNGEAVPIFDFALDSRFIEESKLSDRSSLILLKSDDNRLFALLVDEVQAIERDREKLIVINRDRFTI